MKTKQNMSLPKNFIIKETEAELKKLIKSSSPMIAKRLEAMLVFKRNQDTGISKRLVAFEIKANHNSVQAWRNLYIQGGINGVMSHLNIGYKPSKINAQQQKALEEKLNNPHNGIAGFVELLDWFNTNYKTELNYKTFHGFVVRKFQAKIKVARKTHVNKDCEAVESFKKTLSKSAKKLSPQKAKTTKP